MTEFEIFTVVLSFILGLGVTQILASAVHLAHSRREVSMHWVPILWAFTLFVLHINYLWSALAFYAVERTALWYYVDLLSVVLLFVAGGLVLPSKYRESDLDLSEFFESSGRLALLPLALYDVLAIPYNLEYGSSYLAPENVLHYMGVPLLGVAFLSRKPSIRGFATAVYAGLLVYGALFVWARPGELAG